MEEAIHQQLLNAILDDAPINLAVFDKRFVDCKPMTLFVPDIKSVYHNW